MLSTVARKRILNRRSPAVLVQAFKRTNVSSASSLQNNLIEELKHISLGSKTPGRINVKSDEEVHANKWSTPYDGVFRQSHSKEVMRLWSLLDVCLDSSQFERAESILTTLHPLSIEDNFSFVDDFNKYLNKFAPLASPTEIEAVVANWRSSGKLQTNARTDAIIINALMTKNNPYEKYLLPYLSGRADFRSLLRNVDVFGLQNLKLIVEQNNLDIKFVPAAYRDLITIDNNVEDTNEVTHETNISSSSSPTTTSTTTTTTSPLLEPLMGSADYEPAVLNKQNAEELKSVDTFGMKVIRHTLLSLEPDLNSKLLEKFNEKLEEKLEFFTNDSETQANFFEVYKSLPLDKRDLFEEALNEFNVERQTALENKSIEAAQEKWKHEYEEIKKRGDLGMSKSLNARLWGWFEQMMPLVRDEIERCKNVDDIQIKTLKNEAFAQHSERKKYAPYLRLLDPKKVTVITILEMLKNNSTGGISEGMRTARAVLSVSKALELEFRSEQILNTEKNFVKNFDNSKLSNPKNLKKYSMSLSNFKNDVISDMKVYWPQDIKVKIGSVLISILMHVAKVEVSGVDPSTKQLVRGEAPAFYHSFQYHNGAKIGILKIHKVLSSQLSADKLVGAVQPQSLPMLIQPRPWTSWNNGAYYYSQNQIIRLRDSPEQLAYIKASSDKLDKVYDGLNVLGNTAWTVNERVFKVMSKIWNTGDEFLDIPKAHESLELPEVPPRSSDPSVLNEWKIKVKALQDKYATDRSTRCDANYKLEIARAFLGEKFYFPHNLDFRGRAYPISPNFNHMGSDLSRGLLLFWKGKEIGEEGLRWLKIHLANLFGIDKAPLNEREAFVNDNIELVKRAAEDPMANQEWWTKADKPWQALATIIDLADALKLPDPTKHISHQPVHQDGTCNGLQHYAALGGDVEGATQVNLAPSDKPQDVYTHVAKLVRAKLEEAAANGDENARMLKDNIKRKVVKQTVMTNVYGVTQVGATNQIHKQLQNVFSEDQSYKLSVYLTKVVFASMRELFEGAHLIQDWLAICAKMISKSVRIDIDSYEEMGPKKKPSFMASVIWTTPLDLPIVQPYRAIVKKQIQTNLQTVFIQDPYELHQVDARKQMAAFPPNFIHSLDASHMLLSASSCSKKGLEFAAVHDSYWTHACDVGEMSESLRETFIELHQVDLIARLKDEFDERYKGFLQLIEIPYKSEVGKKILAMRKELTSQLGRPVTLGDEVYLERQRQLLLNSGDENKIAKGESMVTTVSLLENEDLKDLTSAQAMKSMKNSLAEELEESLENTNEYEEEEELKKPVKKSAQKLKVFAPLRLPDIPPKGDFDVNDLRNSKYFFS
ncbi:DNA-directed RNA polymerase, mitochondrial [Wickerhamomyces ciferrii]|uniref:DNA-directed RNA polymerase n=1 Tax=Wickerhamomyces ciferrii (strain ATCC 14091 / BCRC 22168 / CBS 111 / JCM 3599 / NBRC 0793 / NRRL Y-1031 F-60-10) TaxID=1206466 RepID=K0KTX3_WICCF|nr:DNA-directed RNA polymerase, mitochondrial [Wickerhamomyces ciferrii]CCH44839.1 DNA-directed RNA polymerase, mitochondrial [Wickerhamomyces ciferrii]